MSTDEPDSNAATHIVVNKRHVWSGSVTGGDDMEAFESGNPIELTEAELRTFPHRFVEVDTERRVIKDGKEPEEQAARAYRQKHLGEGPADADQDVPDTAEEDDTTLGA